MLIKPKEFYKKNPNFVFPKDLDDPEIHTLRNYIQQEQFTYPLQEIKCKWKVPYKDDDKGILKPCWSAGRWFKKQPGYREVNNHCFFTAIQFKTLTGRRSNVFRDLEGQNTYMFNSELNECIRNAYIFEHGWVIGRFVYIKRGSELGIRPFYPKNDKIIANTDPFASAAQVVTP